MRIVRMLLRAPPAVMYWLGVGQTRAMAQGENAILLCHGTPLRSAAPLERLLRGPNRHLQRGVLPLAWQLNHPPAPWRSSAALSA